MKKHIKTAQIITLTMLATVALFGSGCASILHGGSREVEIKSEPPGANVVVVKYGTEIMVARGKTPLAVSLDPKGGYFRGQTYTVRFEFPGYKSAEVELRPTLSGWYFGNIIFGGLIGMVVVDPLTGSMWNLSPEEVNQDLYPETTSTMRPEDGILVVQLTSISEEDRRKLVRIN